MAHGFVYVLGNESMPGIYKIGFTLKHPRERMAELSRATACPTPFDLLAYIGCEDPQWVEGEIHRSLADYRVNDAREFFKVPAAVIQNEFRGFADSSLDAFFDSPLNHEVYYEEYRAGRKWLVDHFLGQNAEPFECPPRFRGFD